jgi:hypothetical protein
MANATDIVKKGLVRWTDEFINRSTETLSVQTTFYSNAMIGVDTTGYFCKADDTQSWIFAGVVRQDQGCPVLPAGTAGDDKLKLPIQQPRRMELAIASVVVTDIGKKVYALDDQTGTLNAAATTFGNLIGHIVDIVASGIALVELSYDGIAGHGRYGATKVMAATGAQSLTKYDLNKTILLPNTGAYSITLPAVADTQAGDRLTFLKTTADAAAVTLDGNASETIDGATTLATIDAANDTAVLVSTGSAWVVLSRDIT